MKFIITINISPKYSGKFMFYESKPGTVVTNSHTQDCRHICSGRTGKQSKIQITSSKVSKQCCKQLPLS